MEDCLDGEKQQTKGVQISRQTRSQCMKKSVIRASWDFSRLRNIKYILLFVFDDPPRHAALWYTAEYIFRIE